MNFEIFKERLNTDELIKAIKSELDDKFYEYNVEARAVLPCKDSTFAIVSIEIKSNRDSFARTGFLSTYHYFSVSVEDDDDLIFVDDDTYPGQFPPERLCLIRDILIERLESDFRGQRLIYRY